MRWVLEDTWKMALITTDRRKRTRYNWTLLAIIAAIVAAGLVNLYSALDIWGGSGNVPVFWSQFTWVISGLALMAFFSFFDYHLIERAAVPLYVFSIFLLACVLVFGKTVAGHRSWLGVGGLGMQPAEFAKLALVFMLTKYFSSRPNPEGVSLFEMWRPFLFSMIPAFFVVMQGDLGSALFFLLIFATFAWFGQLRKRGIAILVAAAVACSVVLYFFALSNYQKERITSFLNPEADIKGSGYHLVQSRIAVGSGGLWGKGYMKGNVNKLKYLPEKHTDFAFSVLAEEWGFSGSVVVLLLYFLLFYTGIDIAKRARDRTGLFMALGICAFIFWHVVINLGGVLGLIPLTGVTLPLVSYGGSSMVIVLLSLGVLSSISMRRFLF